MSDVSTQVSKAAKKNKKRKGKKSLENDTSAETTLTQKEMLERLKIELEEAKLKKNHNLAGKLREQIWVLTDLIAGVKTEIPQAELLPILERLPVNVTPNSKPPAEPVSSMTSSLCEPERRLKTLHKKKEQISALKQRQANGEVLESNQMEKIKGEDKINEEIDELEEIIEGFKSKLRT